MKRIFIILGIILVVIAGLVFAQNLQIPDETIDSISTGNLQVSDKYYLGEKYTKEINKLIDEEYPKVIKEIDGVFVEFENEKDPHKKENLTTGYIDVIVFNFSKKLLYKTNEFTNLHLENLITDQEIDIAIAIEPYLRSNNVNIEKLIALYKYADKRQEELEKRRGEIVYPSEE